MRVKSFIFEVNKPFTGSILKQDFIMLNSSVFELHMLQGVHTFYMGNDITVYMSVRWFDA